MSAFLEKMHIGRTVALIVVLITVVGFALRMICCFWGLPLLIHPDEYAIVEPAIDMISRHSWEAESYARPDQLEVKIDAILFQIFSWLVYHMPPDKAFPSHNVGFYFVARCATVVFGTALIPLVALLCGRMVGEQQKMCSAAQIFGAAFIAFPAMFVRHSAYATPDVPLTFFCVLFAWFFLNALNDGDRRNLYICAAIIGASVTIKYPAAILLIPLGFAWAYQIVRKRMRAKEAIRALIVGLLVMLFVAFLIAPNIITNAPRFFQSFSSQGGGSAGHLGADGLGFFGNVAFYAESVLPIFGLLSLVPLVFGVVFLFRQQKRSGLAMLIGVVFLICMSVVPLHWVRWMIPFYAFYGMTVAIGLAYLVSFVSGGLPSSRSLIPNGIGARAACCFVWAVVGILFLNAILSGAAIARYSLVPDTRQVAGDYCAENGITAKNSLRDIHTPFAPGVRNVRFEGFVELDDDGKVVLTEKAAGAEYLMISSSRLNRYKAEPERYADEIDLYEGIDAQFDLIWHIEGWSYAEKMCALENIVYDMTVLFGNLPPTGDSIWIYRLSNGTL